MPGIVTLSFVLLQNNLSYHETFSSLFHHLLSLKSRFSKDWTAHPQLSDSVSVCIYWDKDEIRLCLPSNSTLALARFYPMQCVSFTVGPSVGKGRFGSVNCFLLQTKGCAQGEGAIVQLWIPALICSQRLKINQD